MSLRVRKRHFRSTCGRTRFGCDYISRARHEGVGASYHGSDIASAARLLSGNSQRTFHAPRSQLHRSALHRSATMKQPVSKLAAGKQKRKAASEETKAEQRLRSHHQRGCGQKHICKSIWVSEHFLKFRCHAAVARSTFASQNVKTMKVSDVKWHAVVARSTFASQNVKIMRTFDVQMYKIARCCGETHI